MIKAQFNEIIHAPNRLQICALLLPIAELEFKTIREKLNISDSVLSKHLKTLQDANYVSQEKRSSFGRPRTWVSITKEGQQCYEAHVQALKDIVGS